MQNNEDRTRRDGTGRNVSRGSGGRRMKRVKRQKEKMLRREISAILLGTLAAAFFILTEPGKNMISAVTGTSNVPEVSAAAPASEIEEAEPVSGEPSAAGPSEDLFTPDMVPPYSGNAYADINGDVPFFTEEEMTSEAFHEYWPLDELGRCTGAYACVGPETLPQQKRGDISEVKPTGWNTNRYSDIDGEMLFNRCHLIGHMLTGQDANERNLITGTRYMNVEGMLPFEESVVMYVEGTGHHVMYRVRPYFDGDNLVCAGVLMEARSVEDPLVQFCAFCYNVQPGFEIDYATGDNRRAKKGQDEGVQRIVADPDVQEEAGDRQIEDAESGETAEDAETSEADVPVEPAEDGQQVTYIINMNTHVFHMPYCDSVNDMKEKNKKETTLDRESLIGQGYRACQRCHP